MYNTDEEVVFKISGNCWAINTLCRNLFQCESPLSYEILDKDDKPLADLEMFDSGCRPCGADF